MNREVERSNKKHHVKLAQRRNVHVQVVSLPRGHHLPKDNASYQLSRYPGLLNLQEIG